jgi:hypothetical protein
MLRLHLYCTETNHNMYGYTKLKERLSQNYNYLICGFRKLLKQLIVTEWNGLNAWRGNEGKRFGGVHALSGPALSLRLVLPALRLLVSSANF